MSQPGPRQPLSQRQTYPYQRREGRGRPAVIVDRCKLALWIPGELYDRIYQISKAQKISIAQATRQLLQSAISGSHNS